MKAKVMLFLGMFALVTAAAARADDFAADVVSKAKGHVTTGKMFISKDKTRMEMADGVTISRMDKKVIWILMPKDKTYMEQAFDPSKSAQTSEKVNGEIERKLVGKDMVEGKMADKYQVTYTNGRKKETMYQWLVSGIKIPVKTAAADGSWETLYKNIKTSRQPDSLFEVPAGYQKFGMGGPGGMPSFKDMFKNMGK